MTTKTYSIAPGEPKKRAIGKKQRHRQWFTCKNPAWKWTFGTQIVRLKCKKCGLEKNRYLQHRIILWKAGKTLSKHLTGWPSTSLTHQIPTPCLCISQQGPSPRVLRLLVERGST